MNTKDNELLLKWFLDCSFPKFDSCTINPSSSSLSGPAWSSIKNAPRKVNEFYNNNKTTVNSVAGCITVAGGSYVVWVYGFVPVMTLSADIAAKMVDNIAYGVNGVMNNSIKTSLGFGTMYGIYKSQEIRDSAYNVQEWLKQLKKDKNADQKLLTFLLDAADWCRVNYLRFPIPTYAILSNQFSTKWNDNSRRTIIGLIGIIYLTGLFFETKEVLLSFNNKRLFSTEEINLFVKYKNDRYERTRAYIHQLEEAVLIDASGDNINLIDNMKALDEVKLITDQLNSYQALYSVAPVYSKELEEKCNKVLNEGYESEMRKDVRLEPTGILSQVYYKFLGDLQTDYLNALGLKLQYEKIENAYDQFINNIENLKNGNKNYLKFLGPKTLTFENENKKNEFITKLNTVNTVNTDRNNKAVSTTYQNSNAIANNDQITKIKDFNKNGGKVSYNEIQNDENIFDTNLLNGKQLKKTEKVCIAHLFRKQIDLMRQTYTNSIILPSEKKFSDLMVQYFNFLMEINKKEIKSRFQVNTDAIHNVTKLQRIYMPDKENLDEAMKNYVTELESCTDLRKNNPVSDKINECYIRYRNYGGLDTKNLGYKNDLNNADKFEGFESHYSDSPLVGLILKTALIFAIDYITIITILNGFSKMWTLSTITSEVPFKNIFLDDTYVEMIYLIYSNGKDKEDVHDTEYIAIRDLLKKDREWGINKNSVIVSLITISLSYLKDYENTELYPDALKQEDKQKTFSNIFNSILVPCETPNQKIIRNNIFNILSQRSKLPEFEYLKEFIEYVNIRLKYKALSYEYMNERYFEENEDEPNNENGLMNLKNKMFLEYKTDDFLSVKKDEIKLFFNNTNMTAFSNSEPTQGVSYNNVKKSFIEKSKYGEETAMNFDPCPIYYVYTGKKIKQETK